MVTILGKQYKLVFVDTNVLSEICKTEGFLSEYLKLYPANEFILSYSPFSLFEISRNEYVFEKYKKLFFVFPSLVLKANESLIGEEKEGYNSNSSINPMLFAPSAIKNNGVNFSKDTLFDLFEQNSINDQFEKWETSLDSILKEMLLMKSNFPSNNNGKLSKKNALEFVRKTTEQQIYARFPKFSKTEIELNSYIDYQKFPSLKIMAFTTFFKFYSDKKKPTQSDVMDIIISSTVPYVDVFISEGNMISIMKKVKNFDSFINDIKLMSIKNINININEDNK